MSGFLEWLEAASSTPEFLAGMVFGALVLLAVQGFWRGRGK